MKRFAVVAAFSIALPLIAPAQPAAGPADPPAVAAAPVVLLDTASAWRCQMAWRRGLVRTADGELKPLFYSWSKLIENPVALELPGPAAEWVQPAFDDSTWARTPGPITGDSSDLSLAMLCLRGRFVVDDPAKAAPLSVSLDYRGGAIVYVNGQEIARQHLPAGPVDYKTLAEDYPSEAYVDPDGFTLRNTWRDPENYPDRFALRTRRMTATVPATLLRKGVNVLAVQINTAPVDERLYTAKIRQYSRNYCWWNQIGLLKLALSGKSADGLPAAPPAALTVRATNPAIACYDGDCIEAHEPAGPIRITACRNGTFAGAALCTSPAGLAELSAQVSDFAGPGRIAAANATILYAQREGESEPFASRRNGPRLDALLPRYAPLDGKPAKAVPVWVRVAVPADAKPGEYTATLTVRSGGQSAELPIRLAVADWALPDPQGFVSHVGLVQSPESLAMQYNVPMWSDKHWALIDQSFAQLGRAGNKVLFIPTIRRTHFGNEQSMVRYIRTAEGGWSHDFSIVEKYVAAAARHLGPKIPVVCIYAWEPCLGSQYLDPKVQRGLKPLPITVADAKTGELSDGEGPAFGQPEMIGFYRPVFDGLKTILDRHGWGGSMMLGVAGDHRPTKPVVQDMQKIAPGAKWVVHSHATATELHGQPVGYLSDVWNAPIPQPPTQKRHYGWKSEFLRTTFPRAGSKTVESIRPGGPPAQYLAAVEACQVAGIHGLGRIGADFWPVLRDKRGRTSNLLGRFPESNWAQLKLENSFPYILAPGPDGPASTARYEMLLAGVQQAEARIFIEKALDDPQARAKCGEELASRAQQTLDDRTWAILAARTGSDASWLWYATTAEQRSATLFATAAEVAAALKK